ncbi:16S rRNA (cytosine(1402)-N(4))-methyltransferase RsmH [Parvularcula sp. LCG005]|uniref:16S rRNA (cytosine(1402)-N(4))-methyltransferase RsmH n=1 Tax=Parvularcula sp. LCG005 TaxID=3078805 RepID=UPI002943A5C6|nr:16S rRNA (cytosine(1402)-N(4))-methyltransferase RsmH [Parvularcula sp. LCG005]WOI52130.1 16S rRNA (cytosine(1402)-N(4))-methyltransferase RsmH [Parvularcula sp. LCG005]
MSEPHISVLLDEVIGALSIEPGQKIVDGTFGAGGYTRAFLKAGASVIAFDRDPTAIAAGQKNFAGEDALSLIQAPFDRLGQVLTERGLVPVDGAVFDFGVSSMQLDQAERGFSFMADGPLDMRMGEGRPVADFINTAKTGDIADVIHQYGEERRARHIANLIGSARDEAPLTTTAQLAAVVEKALGRGGKVHPATRTFQALRIFINDELGQIVRALIAAEAVLAEGGRLVAVSFHSLEDRIVKRFLASVTGRTGGGSRHMPEVSGPASTFSALGKALTPGSAEVERNVRARSATLRAAVRNAAPAGQWDDARLAGLGIPPLVFSQLQQSWVSV